MGSDARPHSSYSFTTPYRRLTWKGIAAAFLGNSVCVALISLPISGIYFVVTSSVNQEVNGKQ
jgi:hypothetical protein